MAANRTPPPEDRGDLQILWVKLNGSNATIQDALHTVDNLIRRPAAPLNRALPGTSKPKGLTKNDPDERAKEPELFPDHEIVEGQITSDVTSSGVDQENGEHTNNPPPPPPPKRKFPTPKPVVGLNFTDEKTLVSYVGEKKPETDWDKYLVIAQWFKEHRTQPSITPDHVYTAYKFLGANGVNWTIPKDAGAPFRDMKRKKSFWDNGDKKNWWNINHIGEARLNQLPESK